MSAEVILVHGAFHGAWCWSKVLSGLRDRGVAARAIDPRVQERIARHSSRVVQLPTSHSPMLSRPDLVVDLLAGLAEQVTPGRGARKV